MAYSRSEALRRWLGPRKEIIGVLASGHAMVGELTGPGRPLDASKPLANAGGSPGDDVEDISEAWRPGRRPLGSR